MADASSSGVDVERGVAIPLADGTLLSGDLYRPAGRPSGPVLVSYYPYRADDIIGSLFEQTRIGLARRGYATLFADMTGTGASEGSYAESFDLPREGRDCAQIIEWASRQQWCDGSVGAWGVSYGGMNALAAAACRPPHLRGIVAVYATTDMYADTIAPGGCPAMLGRYAWAAHMLALGLCPPTRQDPGGGWERTWRRRLRRLESAPPHALTWQAHPERDDYWQARVVNAAAIEVPAMLIGGWADAYSDAMFRAFGQVGGAKRLIMGPWMHVLPHLSAVEPWDWVSAMADWWDACMAPDAAAAVARATEPPVLYYSHGGGESGGGEREGGESGGWRVARQWPPAGLSTRRFFPAANRLVDTPPAHAAVRTYRGDPLVGLAAGIWDPFGTGSGWPEEQSGDDARSLTCTSDPLPEPLLITGSPEVDLQVGLPAELETNLVARVSMVGADERSTLITSGRLRVPATGGETGGDDGESPSRTITVTMGAAAFEMPAGSRVRLSVACADFPHIWPTPANPWLTVATGPDAASELRLPVRAAAGDAPGETGDEPASIAPPPPGADPGWVSDGEPVYRVEQDKTTGESAVTFGIRSRVSPPSGAELRSQELFTARVRPQRPDGATVQAQVDIGVRMPAGERIQVAVRSTSHRRSSVIEASVVQDGATLLHRRWSDDGTDG
jgi:uncharacterized protein